MQLLGVYTVHIYSHYLACSCMANSVGVKTNLDDTPHKPSPVNDPPAG